MEELQKAGAGLVRVQELWQVQSALRDPPAPLAVPAGPMAVEFDHVTFDYDQTTDDGRPTTAVFADGRAPSDVPSSVVESALPALADVSFRVEPGKVLGLLGRTGSGKTTVSRLLFRLYDPTHGAVRLSGVDVRHARRADLRERIGMVTQDVQLFQATVRDNVTFFDATVPDERILSALENLGLAAWCAALPDGLDTVLGPGGAGLSAGEAQLLAFTRVFLKDPGLVVLDEASSRLDPATERLIESAVERLLAGRTAIIIAHRLATVQRTDEVLIVERGRILEYGPRAALAADPGSHFAALLRTGLESTSDDGRPTTEGLGDSRSLSDVPSSVGGRRSSVPVTP
jgi:ABC-type multidrug transport system fused ATPase/permease subunit